jgi:hypothetical protein
LEHVKKPSIFRAISPIHISRHYVFGESANALVAEFNREFT